jgi:hypothetical protein
MKKIYITGLALFAVVAFSAVAAASAFAEAPEWLVKGVAIPAGVKDATETSGALTLSDLEVPIIGTGAVKCEGFFDGTASSEGKDETTEVLNTAKEKIGEKLTGLALLCSKVTNCEGTSSAWPVGLPFKTQLELVGTKVIDDTTSLATEKLLGYEIECKAFGITVTDTCTQELASPELVNMLEGGVNDLLAITNEENTANCTASGKKSGDIKGEGLVTSSAGEISVSGDGVED